MPTIYISDSGDDKNDGLSLKTAIYSLKRQRNSMAAGMILAGISGRGMEADPKGAFRKKRANAKATANDRWVSYFDQFFAGLPISL